jgi:hypothetical protein
MANIIWTKVQVILTNVPIEYMECDSGAFAGGDEVIVEFIDQDWDQPKVIGYKEEPHGCDLAKIHTVGVTPYLYGNGQYFLCAYRPANDTWEYSVDHIRSGERDFTGAIRNVGTLFIAGGRVWDGNTHVIMDADIYNMSRDIFIALEDYPPPRRTWWDGFFLNNHYFMCGGTSYPDGDHPGYDNNDKYNPADQTWSSAKSLNENRQAAGSFNLGGHGYIMGGMASKLSGTYPVFNPNDPLWQENPGLTSMEKYDAIGDTWAHGRDLGSWRYNFSTFEINGKGYITIGCVSLASGLSEHSVGVPNTLQWRYGWTSSTKKYNPDSSVWSTVANRGDAGPGRAGAGYGENGYSYSWVGAFHNERWKKYDPDSDSWSTAEAHPGKIGDGTTYRQEYFCAV